MEKTDSKIKDSLFSIAFRGRHYVGNATKTANNKESFVLVNVVEFFTASDDKNVGYQGCYLGDLCPLKTTEYLLVQLHPISPLFEGYYTILEDLKDSKVAKPKVVELEQPNTLERIE